LQRFRGDRVDGRHEGRSVRRGRRRRCGGRVLDARGLRRRRAIAPRDHEGGHCIPHSAETYEELRTFVHGERGKMAGQPGKHDDRVMVLALANIAARQNGIGEPLVA